MKKVKFLPILAAPLLALTMTGCGSDTTQEEAANEMSVQEACDVLDENMSTNQAIIDANSPKEIRSAMDEALVGVNNDEVRQLWEELTSLMVQAIESYDEEGNLKEGAEEPDIKRLGEVGMELNEKCGFANGTEDIEITDGAETEEVEVEE